MLTVLHALHGQLLAAMQRAFPEAGQTLDP